MAYSLRRPRGDVSRGDARSSLDHIPWGAGERDTGERWDVGSV